MLTRRSLLTSLVPALGAFAATVQARPDDAEDDAEPKPQPLFERLFPVPTGTNGFEEIIRAGQRLGEARAEYPRAAEFTLDKKRAYLADPACREALAMFRQGITKPIRIPADDPVGGNLIQSFGLMRSLARLLAVDIFVAFADGRSDAAIRTVADGLKLSYALKGVSITAGLVGGATDAILLTTLAQLRESWNAKDCARLTRLANQWLDAPDPLSAALSAERGLSLRFVREWRKDVETMSGQLESHYELEKSEPETDRSREAEAAAKTLRTDGAVRERVFGELVGVINEHYDRTFALTKNPTGSLTLAPNPATDANRHPITLLLRETVVLSAPAVVQQVVEDRLQLRLIAVHAGIRAYRWQYDRLPKTLADMKLPANLVTDPFTGKPLLYEPADTGTGYVLASAGALMPGVDGNPDTRQPVTLPRAPRTP